MLLKKYGTHFNSNVLSKLKVEKLNQTFTQTITTKSLNIF